MAKGIIDQGQQTTPQEGANAPVAGTESRGGLEGGKSAPEGQGLDEGTSVDPREQAQRSALMLAAGRAMYEDQHFDRTMEMLSAPGDPLENVSRGAATLMYMLTHNLENRGKAVSEDVIMDVGEEVLERMLALSAASELISFSSPDEYMAAVEKVGDQALSHFYRLRNSGQNALLEQEQEQQAGAGQPMQGAPPGAPQGQPGAPQGPPGGAQPGAPQGAQQTGGAPPLPPMAKFPGGPNHGR
jgi:hypothetical protein